MPKVLLVGCGDLGGAIAELLIEDGIQTAGLRRSNIKIADIELIQADVTQPLTLGALQHIQPEILIYCVAANGQTDEQYKAHYVDGLRNVLEAQLKNLSLRHIFFISSTRVYGQQADNILDESIAPIASDFGGVRLLEAESLLKNLNCRATVLRLSGIYGRGRVRMISLAKSPQNWPAQNSWTNRIHRDDAAHFIIYLVKKVLAHQAIADCYIVTDSKPIEQYQVLNWIADKMRLGHYVEPPPVEGGKRLSNQKMLSTGFKLKYPDYIAGYQSLLREIIELT